MQVRLRGEGPTALTQRESQVLALLVRGLSDREIGKHLNISPHTVHMFVSKINKKTPVLRRNSRLYMQTLVKHWTEDMWDPSGCV